MGSDMGDCDGLLQIVHIFYLVNKSIILKAKRCLVNIREKLLEKYFGKYRS